jgi:hypothetical protein
VQVKAVTGLCQRGSVRKRRRKKGTKERQLELSTKCYRLTSRVNLCVRHFYSLHHAESEA